MRSAIAKNLAFNICSPLVLILVMVVTVPLYIHQVGVERYGVITIIAAIAGFSGVFDLGLGRSVINSLAAIGEGDPRRRGEIIWTALSLNTVLGAFGGLLVGFGALYVLTNHSHLSEAILAETSYLPLCVGVLIPTTLISGVGLGIFESREKFGLVNAIEVSSGVLIQVGTLVVACFVSKDLSLLVAFATVARLTTVMGLLIYALRLEGIGRPRFPSAGVASSLLRYGSWVAVTNLLNPILMAGDQFVITALLGAAALPFYAVPLSIAFRLQIFNVALARTLFPRFSSLPVELARKMGRQVLEVMGILLPATFGAAIIVSDFVLRKWIGPEFADTATLPLQILLFGSALNAMAYTPFGVLQAVGKPGLVAKAHLLETLPYIALLVLAVSWWGVAGAAAAWSVRTIADYLILLYFAEMNDRTDWRPVVAPFATMTVSFVLALLVPATPYALLVGALFALATLALGTLLSPELRGEMRLVRGFALRRSADLFRHAGGDGR